MDGLSGPNLMSRELMRFFLCVAYLLPFSSHRTYVPSPVVSVYTIAVHVGSNSQGQGQ